MLHSLAVKIRAVSRCSCLLVPVFFHAVTSTRSSYDSLSLELFPLFACARHVVHPSSESSVTRVKHASPRKLIRFNSDGTFSPLLKPGQSVVSTVSACEQVFEPPIKLPLLNSRSLSGVIFSNNSRRLDADHSDSVSSSVQFTNLS